ncbi:bifunctional nuclease 2 isoform X2 [Phalaenopsis equestris]|uniref:bifunctional nuclease 2 isoform X2 n=1 Tax=Phalaenopsis equestris TaxID=78828 RepID=UPI0009E4208D|nr:bifunctional nuclease 2 isoform X2 [Phalaenopsis equestris]
MTTTTSNTPRPCFSFQPLSTPFTLLFLAMSSHAETIRHYNLWKLGFIKENKWHSGAKKSLFYSHRREVDFNVDSIGHGFLRRFQSPTIFLKLACDGGLLLPIIVGEFAIIRLIDSIAGEEHEECPNLLQFVKNIVIKFGYEVKMVRLTDRVVNTYYARVYLRKAADNTNISIDARPSDALNVAEKFKAPIYVNKEIVVKDAIKVVYGNWRSGSTRTVYDVSLDSAPEEPDPLIEELDLVLKLNKAVLEEKFEDAVLWRDKLSKLRMSKQE